MKTTVPDLSTINAAFFPGIDRVCSVEFQDNAPPWRTEPLWRAAGHWLQYMIGRYQDQLNQVTHAADRIQSLILSIDPLLDRLCQMTCFQCPEPCCRVADVSYDFKDLLFIHLTDQIKPPGQPRQTAHDVCRYLGAEGCLLPRFERPWICTWYICAAQKKYIADHGGVSGSQLMPVIEQVGKLRKQMELLFVSVVAP